MKTFNQYITEKLVINKKFLKACDWDDNIDYFFIVTFNSKKDFFIDVRKLNESYDDTFEKIDDNKYLFKSYASISSAFVTGSREETFTTSKSEAFLWAVRKSDRFNFSGLAFYTLLIHPDIVKTYDLSWLNCFSKYNIYDILNKLNIDKNEVPSEFFINEEYTMQTRQSAIEATKEYIDEHK